MTKYERPHNINIIILVIGIMVAIGIGIRFGYASVADEKPLKTTEATVQCKYIDSSDSRTYSVDLLFNDIESTFLVNNDLYDKYSDYEKDTYVSCKFEVSYYKDGTVKYKLIG